jgi:heme exporter protein B
MTSPFKQVVTIIHKDLVTEMRSKDIIISMLVFSLIVVAVFNFIFDPGSEQIKTTAPGILWVAIIFAGNLGLSRSFAREHENAMMQGLLLCPIDRSLIFVAKLIGNIIFISIVEMISVPIMIVLFDLSIGPVFWQLVLILLLGTIGFASVGTLFSTISANTKSREVMLPILLFPVSIPIILAAAKSTTYLLNNSNIENVWSWVRILIAFDLIFTVVCFLLYEYVLEE